MMVQPYLFYEGRCDEALAYYEAALGARLISVMRYRENPQPEYNPPGMDDKVMHSAFSIGDSIIFASDGHASGTPIFKGFSLTISVSSTDEARRLFDGIAKDGSVQMPLTETFYSPLFGMATDKFGVSWMVMTEAAQQCA